ncbi:hypothetical protein MC885_019738 [Smutsia gigantea]|nr:hypothetical protein MC885_019738 [Smutsia gigantea]
MVASSLFVVRAFGLCRWDQKGRARMPGPPKLRLTGPVSWAPARMAATVTLEPEGRSLWDEPVRIAARGLAPGQPVTVRASLRDEKGTLFRAHAHYCADAAGLLDLTRAPALGGSFVGLEPMGLLWALEPEKPLLRLVKRDVRTPLAVELEVLDGHEPEAGRFLGRAVHERVFLGPGVRREPVRAGRVRATLFLPPEPGPFPGIVDIFGAGGGLVEYRASLLAKKGFAVLALAYYNYEDLPKGMETLHLEYFEEAVNYLLKRAEVKGPGVGLLGISKGGDLCLSMASFLKGITAAVIINGSVANVGGVLHYKGETLLPPLGSDRNRIKVTKDGFADILDVLNSPLEGPDQKSLIPVERADSTFLFLVGQDDHNWKSEFYANEASKRLEAHGKDKPQIICYPGAGHYIEPPYFPMCRASLHTLVGSPTIWGGEPRAHARAQVDAWKQLQTFFHKHLDVLTPLTVELEVLDGHEPEAGRLLGRAVQERDFLGPGVRREPVRAGRVRATLFLPPGTGPFPGIIDIFGTGGGLLEYRASLLAGHGFATLALAYYDFEDLPKKSDSIYLDYFEEALCYMLQHSQVKGPGIGLLGTSLGADICLSMASFMKNISATVSINGSGFSGNKAICYKQTCIPSLGHDLRRTKVAFSGLLDIVDIRNDIVGGCENPSIIPLEKADGPILFIVGQDDHNWRSELYAQTASERLQAHGKGKPQIISYPGTGHYIEPPYFPMCPASLYKVVNKPFYLLGIWGGEPRAHSKAQVDAWKHILTFFCKHLGGTQKGASPKL